MNVGTALAGTFPLARARLRVERVRLALWTAGIIAMVGATAASMRDIFPTQADLDAAASGSDNPAIRAFNGPAQALDTLGGQVAFQVGAPGFVIAALASILLTSRLTRREEESGRLELVRSLPVGRGASMASAAAVLGVMHTLIGLGVALTCVAADLPTAGAWAFGLGFATVGWMFTAVTLVAAQVMPTSRATNGLAGAILAIAFVLRAIGDMTDGTLSWLSPIGWAQAARPWADERWWVFVIPMVATAVTGAAGRALLNRRDLGSGLFPQRRGPAAAAETLNSPLALAARLQLPGVAGWSAGLAVFGFVYGVIIDSIEDFIRDNEALADFMAASGEASLTDAYLAQSMRVMALMASGFAAQSVLRARSEETAGRAEPLLAGAISRRAWLGSHTLVAVLGSAIVALVVAGSVALGVVIATGESDAVPGVFEAAIAHLPAQLIVIGAGLAVTAWFPRATGATWAVVAGSLVIGMFGPVLDLPTWVANISPFEHVAMLPAESWSLPAFLVLTLLAMALIFTGFAGIVRRDLPA